MTVSALPRINVVGLGKLGAPLAAVLASRGERRAELAEADDIDPGEG